MKTINPDQFRQEVQNECVEALLSRRYASGDVAMRLGKTLIGLRVSQSYNSVLVCYPNKSILNSWISDAKTFGINTDHITFSTMRSLEKHKLDKFDCVIVDEIDQLSTNNWIHILNSYDSIDLKGLSGTMPIRGEKHYLIQQFCPIAYVKKLDETIGHTSKDYTIYVHMVAPSLIKNIPLKKGGFWSESAKISFFDRLYQKSKNFQDMLVLMRLISNSESKFQYALSLIKKIGKGFLFLETIDQCERSGYPSYHGKNPNSEENLALFREGKIDILVSINQLKAGITVRNLKSAVIVHSYSSNNRTAQKIGRCLNYIEDEVADIHVVCLAGTRDEMWTEECLSEFDQSKVIYV